MEKRRKEEDEYKKKEFVKVKKVESEEAREIKKRI